MPTASVNGTTLHYEMDGQGWPCLVLHGGLGIDHSLYRATLPMIAPTLRLVCFDQRGNGRSGRPPTETLTIEQLADNVAGLADYLGLDRFLVFGHSYGGFVGPVSYGSCAAAPQSEHAIAVLVVAMRAAGSIRKPATAAFRTFPSESYTVSAASFLKCR